MPREERPLEVYPEDEMNGILKLLAVTLWVEEPSQHSLPLSFTPPPPPSAQPGCTLLLDLMGRWPF